MIGESSLSLARLRVMRLRRKIEVDPEKPEVLKTVRGVGYIYCMRSSP